MVQCLLNQPGNRIDIPYAHGSFGLNFPLYRLHEQRHARELLAKAVMQLVPHFSLLPVSGFDDGVNGCDISSKKATSKHFVSFNVHSIYVQKHW